MNTYTAGLNGKTIEIEAKTLWDATYKAREIFKAKKKDYGYIWVILNTTHDAAILD